MWFRLFTIVCAIVLSLGYIIYKPPTWTIKLLQSNYPDVLWRISTKQKIVALTIDDAPSEYTEEILEILKANDATATFFVIGSQVPGNEKILKDIIRGGNELGNHAMHDEPSRGLSDAVLRDQLDKVQDMIHAAYDELEVPRPQFYFRPGSGFLGKVMIAVAKKMKYQIVLGSIYPHDPQIQSAWANAKHILSMKKPGGVIICHDRRPWTAPMLREVLPKLKKEGYRVMSVTNMLILTDSKKFLRYFSPSAEPEALFIASGQNTKVPRA